MAERGIGDTADPMAAHRAETHAALAMPPRRPFGLGLQKPRHFREMLRVAWENRGRWGYAWRILTRGTCDGCALGTTGLRDWTLEHRGVHLCLVRLGLLRLNTMPEADPRRFAGVRALRDARQAELHALGRLGRPMRRRRGEPGFTVVDWPEALSEIGERLAATDPAKAACYLTSRGLGNEVYYAVQKAWRLYGSPHVDNAARLCHSPSTAAMKRVLGVAASTCSYRDWYDADLVVLLGTNLPNDQPVAVKYLDEARRLHGTRVVAVNPLQEPGLRHYWIPSSPASALFGSRIVDRFVPVATGGDQALLLAVLRLLVERGQVDRAFVERHTRGFEEMVRPLLAMPLEELVRRSGTPRDDVLALADEIGRAERAVYVWSMGITQHTHGTPTVEAICQLALARGHVGRAGCGLMPIRGHSGVQGGAEMGAYATAFPGGRPVDEDTADELAEQWGFRPPAQPGMDAVQMLEAAARGELQALYQIGGNFRDTLPQPEAVERALGRIPLRIHQDIVFSRAMLAEPADVVYVLPARTRYEHRGGITETTTERRVVFSPEVPGPRPAEALEEWRIALEIVRAAVGPTRFAPLAPLLEGGAEAIRADIARTVPGYAGIEKLRAQGDHFQWGGRWLCEGGRFGTPDGRARFVFTEPPDRGAPPAGRLRLSTRRGKQFNSIVQAERDPLTGAARDEVLVSEEDLQRLGLRAGQRVRLRSEHGTMEARLRPAPIQPGNLQAHWPEANVLLSPLARDTAGGVPDYNALVAIEALASETRQAATAKTLEAP